MIIMVDISLTIALLCNIDELISGVRSRIQRVDPPALARARQYPALSAGKTWALGVGHETRVRTGFAHESASILAVVYVRTIIYREEYLKINGDVI